LIGGYKMKHKVFTRISGFAILSVLVLMVAAMPSHAATMNYKYYYDIDFFLNGHTLHVLPGSSGELTYTSTWWDDHGLNLKDGSGSWNYHLGDTYRSCGVSGGSCDADKSWNLMYSNGFYIQDYNLWTNYFQYLSNPKCWDSNCRYHPYGVEVRFYSNTYYPFNPSGVDNYYNGVAYHVVQMSNQQPITCKTCSDYGYSCGTVTNNCGQTLDCGSCGSNFICTDHSCVVPPKPNSCSDSDSGIDYYDKGTVSGYYKNQYYSKTDSCNDQTLTEFYCQGSKAYSQTYTCSYGCVNGACVKQPNTCSDTDNGNIYQKGTVSGIFQGQSYSYSDYCSQSGTNIHEYSCNNGLVVNTNYVCTAGCDNGACKKANVCQENNYQCGILQLQDDSVVNCGQCSEGVCRLGQCIGKGKADNTNPSSGDWEVTNNPLRARDSAVKITGSVYSIAVGGSGKNYIDKGLVVAVPKYNYYSDLSLLNSINRSLIVRLYYLKQAGYGDIVSTTLSQYANKKDVNYNTLTDEFNTFSSHYSSGNFNDMNSLISSDAPNFSKDTENNGRPSTSMHCPSGKHLITDDNVKMCCDDDNSCCHLESDGGCTPASSYGTMSSSGSANISYYDINSSYYQRSLAGDMLHSLPLPGKGQYFIGFSNDNGDYSIVVNNGWDYTVYAIADLAGGTVLKGSKNVHTELGNTNPVHADIPMYSPDCTDVCGVDISGQCNPNCYDAKTVASCNNIDNKLLNAFVNNCIPAADNTKVFDASDSKGVMHTLTCCDQVSPYVIPVSASNINVTNSSDSEVISKNIFYKNMPAMIKMIITS